MDERRTAEGEAAAKSRAAEQAKPKAAVEPKKLSALDAAAKVLAETGEAMNCRALIEVMAARGLWSSPGGLTPHATLYAAILREMANKGKDARFKKVDRGRVASA
jgi:vancomycin resistance protein YoaR